MGNTAAQKEGAIDLVLITLLVKSVIIFMVGIE